MNVLITRPKRQAKLLAKHLQAHGDVSICLPAIEIKPPRSPVAMQRALQNLAAFDMLIFISPNAVIEFVKHIDATQSLPCVLALGQGTAKMLQQHDIKVADYPPIANSKALLALARLHHVAGKKIAIFAGEEGNTLLANTLKQRGVVVTVAYTHRRCLPEYQLPFAWQATQIDVSVCTSLASLYNFHTLIKRYQLDELHSKALIVITAAMQITARQLGFKSAIMIANDASNAAIMLTLQQYREKCHG